MQKIVHLSFFVFLTTIALLIFCEPDKVSAQGPSTFDNLTLYVRRSNGGPCELTDVENPSYSGTMRDFIVYSLPYEWNASSGLEAYKAGAVAIRTFALNPRHHTQIVISSQTYRCVFAFQMLGFDSSPPPNNTPNNFPLSGLAITQTNGIYMIHPQAKALEDIINPVLNSGGAIDAQFRNETGVQTKASTDANDFLYLQSIYDPISPPLTPQTGMGQNGSSRWAVGKSNFTNPSAPVDFPRWLSYLQILTHYYTGIQVIQDNGAGNRTTLTPDFRWNMLLHQTNPLTPAPGSPFSATVVIQNTGVFAWPLNSNYPLSYWWVNSAGQSVTAPTIAARLSASVAPGAVTTQTLNIIAPSSGPYTLTYRLSRPWAQPHFDATNSRADPDAGPPGSITLLWQTSGSPSTQLLADGLRVYYQTNGGVQAHSFMTGQQQWNYFNNGLSANSSMTLAGDRLVTGRLTNGAALALNTVSGTVVWSQTVGAATPPISPVAADGRVYVVVSSGSNSLNLYNFDPVAGTVGWGGPTTIGNPPDWRASPVQMPAVAEGIIYLSYQSAYLASGYVPRTSLAALSAANGNLLWTTDIATATTTADPCGANSPPLVAGGRLFMGLRCPTPQIVAVNLATRQVEWRITGVSNPPQNFSDSDITSLAYYRHPQTPRLLVTSNSEVWGLDPATGQQMWRWQPSFGGGSVWTKATIGGNHVWIAAGGGVGSWWWYVVSASSGAELIFWPAPGNMDRPELYPIISGDTLFFTTVAAQRCALSISSGQSTSWFNQIIPPAAGGGEAVNKQFLPIILKE